MVACALKREAKQDVRSSLRRCTVKYNEMVDLAAEVETLRKIVKLAKRAVTLWALGCNMSFHETMSKLKVALEASEASHGNVPGS